MGDRIRRSALTWAEGALFGLLFVSVLIGCKEEQKAAAPPPPEVLVAAVEQKTVPIYNEWVGTTDGFINAEIRAKVSGYLMSKDYREGGLVKAGQVMFEIDPRQFQAALDQSIGDQKRAEAALEKSRQDVARYTPLAAEGAVSQKELDDAIQAMRANQASVDAAGAAVEQARLNLGWTKVTAPIDGVAGIAIAQIGDLIGETTLLTTVSQLDPIKVYFPVSEQEYLTFAKRISADLATGPGDNTAPLELILANGSVYDKPGKFQTAGLNVDLKTGTIQVQALFPNPDNILRPGQFARVRAPIRMAENALLIPQRAVIDNQGTYQVAVVGSDDKVEMRNVKPGERVGSDWIIDEGLKPGDRVVVEGLQKVKTGVTVVPKPYDAKAAVSGAAAKPAS